MPVTAWESRQQVGDFSQRNSGTVPAFLLLDLASSLPLFPVHAIIGAHKHSAFPIRAYFTLQVRVWEGGQ